MPEILAPFRTVHAPSAMVASADHLASQAGMNVLAQGGSAADAAIATNAVLAVTAPHMCGMGGDLFALVHDGDGGARCALNASGRAGSGADPERLRAEGHAAMPFRLDIRCVTVPGCVDGWLALHERFGRSRWRRCSCRRSPRRRRLPGVAAAGRRRCPAGRPSTCRPTSSSSAAAARRPGDLVRRPGAARTLAAIAAEGRDGFYAGEFGDGLLGLGGGEFAEADLARAQADWVDPLHGPGVGAAAVDGAAELAGLPDAGGGRHRRRAAPCPAIPTTPCGPTC